MDPREHFLQTLGNVPPSMETMLDASPGLMDGYAKFRMTALENRPDGLDTATKELLLVLLDVVYDNPPGALNHLQAGQRAGLTSQAVLDGLMLVWLVGGVQTWGKAGHEVYAAAVRREQEGDLS